MFYLLVAFLLIALLGLFFITKEQNNKSNLFDQRRDYNNKDYLEEIKMATKKRFEEEEAQQAYKNNIRKNNLE